MVVRASCIVMDSRISPLSSCSLCSNFLGRSTQSPDGEDIPEDIPAAQIVREMQPDAKFIITLSNPVKRMYSDYNFLNDNMLPVRPGSPAASLSGAAGGEAEQKSAAHFHERAVLQVNGVNKCIEEEIAKNMEKAHLDRSNVDFQPGHIGWFRAAQMYGSISLLFFVFCC